MRYETSIIIKQKSGKFAKNPCNYCGDGVLADSETCGEATLYNRYGASPTSTSGTQKAKGAAEFTVSNGYKYYINIPGVYCFIAKGGDGNVGQSGNNGCSGATVAACYKLQKDDVVTFKVGSLGAPRPALTDSSNSCATFYGGGGGGGASWVYLTRNSANTLLLVAGGGGGGGWHNDKNYCGAGSNSTSATSYTNDDGKSGTCSKDTASAGTTVNENNFASITVANGGDGGFHSSTSGCNNKTCDGRYACGGGGGYVGGVAGVYDNGGGGGSYVNTSFTSYDTSYATSTMVAGTTGVNSPSAGSIKVSNPKCLTCTECKYTTTYGACN